MFIAHVAGERPLAPEERNAPLTWIVTEPRAVATGSYIQLECFDPVATALGSVMEPQTSLLSNKTHRPHFEATLFFFSAAARFCSDLPQRSSVG